VLIDVLDEGCTTQEVIHPKTVAGLTCSGIELLAADFAQYLAKPYKYLDQAISSTLGQNYQTWSHYNHPKLMDQKLVEQTREVALEQTREVALEQTREVALVQTREVALVQTREVALVQTREVALVQTREVALVQTREVALVQTREVALEQTREVALEQTREVALEQTLAWEDELKMRMNAKLV
jgi:hypothetical protein